MKIYIPHHGVPSVVCKLTYKDMEYRVRVRAAWPCVLYSKRSAERPYEETQPTSPTPELLNEYITLWENTNKYWNDVEHLRPKYVKAYWRKRNDLDGWDE